MQCKLAARKINFYYNLHRALENISMEIPERRITTLCGPPASGKSTLLRTFNRMNDPIPNHKIEGDVLLDGESIYSREYDPMELRRRVGMVFWRNRPFAESVLEEFSRRLKTAGLKKARDIEGRIEDCLREAQLWDDIDIGEKLDAGSHTLDNLQLVKLSVARTLAHEPEVILLDEPLTMLERSQLKRFSNLILNLKERYTVVMATRNRELARLSDYTAFLEGGRLVSFSASAIGS